MVPFPACDSALSGVHLVDVAVLLKRGNLKEKIVTVLKEWLDAGVHFGHPMNRWNPKMARYIFGERSNIYVIDLEKTMKKCTEACNFVKDLAASGESILFVGTKRQAQAVIEEEAKRAGMFYVTQRWLGGMLTNFATIRQSIDRLKKIEMSSKDGTYERLPKKEVIQLEKERGKLEKTLSGIRDMNQLPGAVFVIDTVKERICVQEAKRLNIPLIAIADTNCDPDEIDYVIPGNDDGVRAIRLVTRQIVDAALAGKALREKMAPAANPAPAPTPPSLPQVGIEADASSHAKEPVSATAVLET